MKLPQSYYLSEDVVGIAQDLLGKLLFSKIDNQITAGIISETEAYAGITDKASHAFGELKTHRTKVLYQQGGCSYVYLCYGIHHLFNVVTGPINQPHAVLIRGIIPILGRNEMEKRIKKDSISYKFTNGPGKLTKALGITTKLNNEVLTGARVWIEEGVYKIRSKHIITSQRIGVAYAKEDALLPYRFNLNLENVLFKPKNAS